MSFSRADSGVRASGRLAAALTLLIGLQLVEHAIAQDVAPGADLQRRRLEYLERSPFSDEAFEALLAGLDPLDGHATLAAQLEAELAAAPEALAARVLLARLVEREGHGERALAMLAEVGAPAPELRVLAASFAARAGEFERALEWTAIDWTDAPRALAERARRERAHALAELGELERARAELERLLARAPTSALLALEVASLAETHQMHSASAHFHARAAELATDAAARARALAGAARALERLGRVDEALDACARAAPLVGRGHWLGGELAARQLALHERAGTLPQWLDELRIAVTAAPGDAGAHEALAVALEGAGQIDESARALAAAVEVLPDDLALSRARRRLARLAGDPEVELDELARIAARRPDDRELGFELAAAYAARGRVDAAHRRFEALAEGRADDAGFLDRVAAAWDAAGRPEEALRASEQALSAEPRDLRRHLELVARLERALHAVEARAGLRRAEEEFAEDATALAELARTHARRGDRTAAVRLVERALALDPEDAGLRLEQGEWLAELGRADEALRAYRAALELARTPALRDDALLALLQLIERRRDSVRIRRREERRLDELGESLTARLLLAALCESLDEPDTALENLRAARRAFPLDEGVAHALAGALERADRDEEALAVWSELIELAPTRRRAALRAMHRLHARAGERELAAECLERARRDAARSPAALLELATDFERLGFDERARACVEQAARMAPEDCAVFLRLAHLYQRAGDREGARKALVAAWMAGEGEQRALAARRLDEWALSAPLPQNGLAALQASLGRDRDGARLVAELYLRAGSPVDALATLDPVLHRHPFDPELLQERAAVLLELARGAEATLDIERALRLPDAELDALRELHLRACLMTGEHDRALAIADTIGDALAAAEHLIEAGEPTAAEQLLRRHAWRDPGASASVARLVELFEAGYRHAAAKEALEELGRRRGLDDELLRRIGDHALELGLRADAVEAGRRMVALGGFRPETRAWFTSAGLQRDWARLRLAHARREPLDAAAIEGFFEEAAQDEGYVDPALLLSGELFRALEGGELPPGHTPVSWYRALVEHELALYRAARTRRLERLEDILRALASQDALSEREWLHLFVLEGEGGWLSPEQASALERALSEHPDSELLLALAARRYEASALDQQAGACWARLTARLTSDENRAAEAIAQAVQLEEHVERVKRWLPTHLRALTGSAELRELASSSVRIVAPRESGGRLVPSWDEAARRELAALGTGPVAAARFAELRGQAADELEHASWLAQSAFAAGLPEEARTFVDRLVAAESDLFERVPPSEAAEARAIVIEPWSSLAESALEAGLPVEGMRLLQRAGRRRGALAFVARNELYERLRADLRGGLAAASAAPPGTALAPSRVRALREAVFSLVELEMLRAPRKEDAAVSSKAMHRITAMRVTSGGTIQLGAAPRPADPPPDDESPIRARAALTELLELLPDDVVALRALSSVEEHLGHGERARLLREQALEVCAAPPAWLVGADIGTPQLALPEQVGMRGVFGAGMRASGAQVQLGVQRRRGGGPMFMPLASWLELERALGEDPLDPGVDHLALFRMALSASGRRRAADELARLGAARPEFVRNQGDALATLSYFNLDNRKLVPCLRELDQLTDGSKLVLELLFNALRELGRNDEVDALAARLAAGR